MFCGQGMKSPDSLKKTLELLRLHPCCLWQILNYFFPLSFASAGRMLASVGALILFLSSNIAQYFCHVSMVDRNLNQCCS